MLSKSVADALAYFEDPTTEETETFIRYFDRFFDSMNVHSFSEWKTSRKPDRKTILEKRARGGKIENPTVQRALQNAGALRIQKSLALDPVRGNSRYKCRLYQTEELTISDIDNTPLPKRKRHTHKK